MLSQDDKTYLINELSEYIATQENPRLTLISGFSSESGFPGLLQNASPKVLVNQAINICIQQGWKNEPPWLLTLLMSFPTEVDARIDEIRQNIASKKSFNENNSEIADDKAFDFRSEIQTLGKLIDGERQSTNWFWIVSLTSLAIGLAFSVYFYYLPNNYLTQPSERLEIIRLIVIPVPSFIGISFWMLTRNRYTAGKKHILLFEHLKGKFESGNVNDETRESFERLVGNINQNLMRL